ncbi:hypothetical protein BHM03_00062311, partial [Ensete ventricosum]
GGYPCPPPCQGAATPAAGDAAPTSDRAGRGRQPLASALQPAPLCRHRAVSGCAACGCRPYGLAAAGRNRGWLLPSRGALLLVGAAHCGLALAAADRPLQGALVTA